PFEVLDREHGARHAEAPEQAPDEIPARVVGLDEADDVIALLRKREQRLRDRPDARGGDEAVIASLQLRQSELELARRRIGGARVEEPRPLAAQVLQGLLERLELQFD